VNNPLDPSEGSLVTATFLYASRLVGSDSSYEFNRAEFEMSHYYPIGRRAVFRLASARGDDPAAEDQPLGPARGLRAPRSALLWRRSELGARLRA